jgi:ATP-dependent RNA helicase DBP3
MSGTKPLSEENGVLKESKKKRRKVDGDDADKAERRARKELRRKEKAARLARQQDEVNPSTPTGALAASHDLQPPPTYNPSPSLQTVPASAFADFLDRQQVTITDPTSPNGAELPRPILEFDQLPASELVSKYPFTGFKAPTPIQSASWPFLLAGRDVIGIAETGSGKTLAFAVPCIERLSQSGSQPTEKKMPKTRSVRALVVAPTRELAMQTHKAMASMASLVGLSAVCLFGGTSKDEQRAALRQRGGADIVVATPGRLKDFLQEGAVDLSQADFVVLDEADRMLDKGFEDDIKEILGQCAPISSRQTLMFTATWPRSIQQLAEGFMTSPVRIRIGGTKTDGGKELNDVEELQANKRIVQEVEVVDPRGKEQRLLQLLKTAQTGQGKKDRVLVFCLYKKEAVRVHEFLERRGVHVVSIHGDLRQEQRTKSLEAFRSGATSVLVATDVAARGLDIPEVKVVINLTVRCLCISIPANPADICSFP